MYAYIYLCTKILERKFEKSMVVKCNVLPPARESDRLIRCDWVGMEVEIYDFIFSVHTHRSYKHAYLGLNVKYMCVERMMLS